MQNIRSDRIVHLHGKPVVIVEKISYREGHDDYKLSREAIESILNSQQVELEGVWEAEWTEISPGITTRLARLKPSDRSPVRYLRIEPVGCPIYVQIGHYWSYGGLIDQHGASADGVREWVCYKS